MKNDKQAAKGVSQLPGAPTAADPRYQARGTDMTTTDKETTLKPGESATFNPPPPPDTLDTILINYRIDLPDEALSHRAEYGEQEDTARNKAKAQLLDWKQSSELEARRSERAWAYKNMRDHGTEPQWVEVAKQRYEKLRGEA